MKIAKIIPVVFLLYALSAHATIYMQKDTEGNVSYSDTPNQNAQEVPSADLKSSSISQSTTTSTAESTGKSASTEEGERVHYTLFKIISPGDEETIPNQPTFTVKLKTDPELQQGDKIQIFIDGKPFGTGANSTSIDITNLDRGTHKMYAVILDENNVAMKATDEITIYNRRASLINNPAVPQPKVNQ